MRILLGRAAGHGDVLALTSALPGLVRRYPGAEIDFAAGEGYGELVRGHRLVKRHQCLLLPAEELAAYDLVLLPDHGREWDDWIERVQCRICGVPFHPPELHLTRAELDQAQWARERVAVGSHTRALERQYNQVAAALALLKRSHDLVQVDDGPDCDGGVPHPAMTIRQAAAVIAQSAFYFGVSTSFVHVAAALGKPMVLVLGPTGPENGYMPDAILLRHGRSKGRVVWPTGGIDYPPELVALAFEVRLGRAAPTDDFEYTNERGEVVPWREWRPRPPESSWTSS